MTKLISGILGVLIVLSYETAYAVPVVDLMLSAPGFTSLTIAGTSATPPSFNGSYAGYTFNVGTVGNSTLISYAIQVSSTPVSPPSLTVSLSETGLTGFSRVFTSYNTANLHTNSTVHFATYYDVTDTVFGQGTLVSSGSVTGPNSSFSNGPFARLEPGAALYSLTKVITLDALAGAFPTIDGQVFISAPEPMSLTLLGTGLAVLGVGRRVARRRAGML